VTKLLKHPFFWFWFIATMPLLFQKVHGTWEMNASGVAVGLGLGWFFHVVAIRHAQDNERLEAP
jgi:threonine/homoserine/homoserine lactone efflux protein